MNAENSQSRTRSRPAVVVFVIIASMLLASTIATSCASENHSANVSCATKSTVQYSQIPGVDPNLTSLDIFTPAAEAGSCEARPLVVWIHGGGWYEGDRSEYMDDKIALFNGAGFVFATINYRLTDTTAVPAEPQYPVHNLDAADAVSWLTKHADAYGIDADRIAVLGHSAGGGITAAISTDERFLGRNGLPLRAIRCAGSMDGEGYDIVAGATSSDAFVSGSYRNVFGTDPAVWAEASPIRHVSSGKGIPRFFIAARGVDWRMDQHNAFIAALDAAGVSVTVLDVSTLSHADLTTQIGRPDDMIVTPALLDFLGGCFSNRRR